MHTSLSGRENTTRGQHLLWQWKPGFIFWTITTRGYLRLRRDFFFLVNFWFWNKFIFTEKLQIEFWGFPYILCPVSANGNIFSDHAAFVKIIKKKLTSVSCHKLHSRYDSDFTHFSINIPGSYVVLSRRVSSVSSNLWPFFCLSLFIMTLTIVQIPGQTLSLPPSCLMFSSKWLKLWVLRKKIQKWSNSKITSHRWAEKAEP